MAGNWSRRTSLAFLSLNPHKNKKEKFVVDVVNLPPLCRLHLADWPGTTRAPSSINTTTDALPCAPGIRIDPAARVRSAVAETSNCIRHRQPIR